MVNMKTPWAVDDGIASAAAPDDPGSSLEWVKYARPEHDTLSGLFHPLVG
jgi:hypothetical protein